MIYGLMTTGWKDLTPVQKDRVMQLRDAGRSWDEICLLYDLHNYTWSLERSLTTWRRNRLRSRYRFVKPTPRPVKIIKKQK